MCRVFVCFKKSCKSGYYQAVIIFAIGVDQLFKYDYVYKKY